MIIAKDVSKRFGAIHALDQVSFTIEAGEAVALWGSNGAGKTTTLRCILGVQSFAGELSVNGINVREDGKSARAQIGYVPQEAVFYNMTVHETLIFYSRLKKADPDQIPAVLGQVNLEVQRNKRVETLSGGMKQRLALAVALLGNPPVLMLDEPTANLDVAAQRDFMHMIQSLNAAGKTIIFSSHRLDEVTALAGRVLVLDDGKLILDCHPAELADRLGLRRWMRIWVDDDHKDQSSNVLDEEGFVWMPNGSTFYVQVNGRGKLAPLNALQSAQIPVEDFEMVDSEILPVEEGKQ